MKVYTVKRIAGLPDWSVIPDLKVDNALWLPDHQVRMTQQVCYDDAALYVHQRAVERHIRAEHTSPLSQVCEDSCMEFFFCPDPDSDRYFNFEFNPNGCLFLGWCRGREQIVRLLPWSKPELFDVHVSRTDDGWEIFYRIPLSFIQLFCPAFALKPGTILRANCYKCGDKTVVPHYLAWNPCTSETPNFHRPCDFGQMVLGD